MQGRTLRLPRAVPTLQMGTLRHPQLKQHGVWSKGEGEHSRTKTFSTGVLPAPTPPPPEQTVHSCPGALQEPEVARPWSIRTWRSA